MSWIPVKETLPEDIGHYLCYCTDGVQAVFHINALGAWTLAPPKLFYGDMYGNAENYKGTRRVTHWMPLPKPPKEEE